MRPCVFTADRNGPKHRQRARSDVSTAQLDGTPNSLQGSDIGGVTPQAAEGNVPESSNLADSMMRTVVSNGNDALNLLFEAASQNDQDAGGLGQSDLLGGSPVFHVAHPTSPGMIGSSTVLPNISSELWDIWNAYRFVKMGWFSAEEAVWLLDM